MSTSAKLLLLASLTAATLAWPTSSAVAETAVKPAAAPVASQTPEAKTSANAEAAAQATGVNPNDKSSAQASGSPNDKPSGNPSDKPSVPGEPPVLDPYKFFGHAKSGYAAAQLCPEICAKIFC
ncbi:hypothetical protein KA344_19375, partial [bacterium]|nr:hypothetical protein [bacterium]